MKKHYSFGGAAVTLEIPDDFFPLESGRLADFEAEAASDPWSFTFQVVDQLDPPEGELLITRPTGAFYTDCSYRGMVQQGWAAADMRIHRLGKEHFVQWKRNPLLSHIPLRHILQAMDLPRLAHQAGGVLLHCSVIDRKGKAIVFTAPSGTGKSTQAQLWNTHRGSQIINGDRAVIRMADGVALAEGIPVSGSSEHCLNRTLPLEAIVYLSQAPETTIRPLRGGESFRRVWEGCTVSVWDSEEVNLATEAVTGIVTSTPVYHLACTPDESPVIALERMLESR